jgi:hypothetical protein
MIRGYTDEGRVHVGAAIAPALKRDVVNVAYRRGVTVSDVIRAALAETVAAREATGNDAQPAI